MKFKDAGCSVEPVSFRFPHTQNEYAELWCRSICFDTATDMELWKKNGFDIVRDHRQELPEEFIYWNDVMIKGTMMDIRRINEMRTEILDAQEDVFRDFDIILSPVTICPPVRNAEDGLPVGMQIIGRKFMDEDVLAAAYTYEQVNPWSYDIPFSRKISDNLK